MQTITAVIPVKNEAINITRALKSVLWCDQIMVLSMSTDNTDQIAKKLGATVVNRLGKTSDDVKGVQENVNWAIDHCQTDWILRIDADEVVTKELSQEIKAFLQKPAPTEVVAYGIPRRPYFLTGFLEGGDWAYDRLVRLFRPQYCRYNPIVAVHEQFKVSGEVGYLKQSLLHYSHPNMQTLLTKFNYYTTLDAQTVPDSHLASLFKLVFNPPYIFLRWLIYHHGYRDGIRGVIAALMRGFYDFLLYAKRIECLRAKKKQ